MDALVSKADRIRQLNDAARRTFTGARIMTTSAFAELPTLTKAGALMAVRDFNKFDEGNDPHHEHDMAFFELGDEKYFFKFDYYAPDMEHGSEDPADPQKTTRVLTIGLASDY